MNNSGNLGQLQYSNHYGNNKRSGNMNEQMAGDGSMHPHGAMGQQQVHSSQVYNNMGVGNQHDYQQSN